MTTQTTKALKRCCGSSVGIIITDEQDRLLMVERGWFPHGIAPVAGHVYDEHTDVADALAAEVEEEVGLTVTSSERIGRGHIPNLCASLPAQPRPGHHWWLYRATATGALRPALGETKGAAWYTPREVRALADRTLAHARGEITQREFETDPGLEAVWVLLLHEAGLLQACYEELVLARKLYTVAPDEYWLGGRP
ncbi:NUDIX hydrolase [Nocardiopsis sp. CT-R113]|uniref:NUDIX hydrolase n=1 Tax=Nocardiopsis codii TaxID=3065942 RepID=A0ABU7KH82_9ACTN|nr:NUDIX hydrolase [Nocardiopsis sp. CT-R113]MEE2041567.1 NUDIX hydrolase [Nocardiopsis sp. CT-R113]